MKKVIISHKNIGETPLECLERERVSNNIDDSTPMTYAGRLDPMAEGVMIFLIDEECKNKEKYLGLNKEYEIEIVLGLKTDSYDTLGIILDVNIKRLSKKEIDFNKYIGKFEQKYPIYSSKTLNGIQLHEYARKNKKIEQMPKKEVEIFSIKNIGRRSISGKEMAENIIERINKIKGDFRQIEIISKWKDFMRDFGGVYFSIIKLKVKCSSGVYMRVLAENIGNDTHVGAIACSINRTKIGEF